MERRHLSKHIQIPEPLRSGIGHSPLVLNQKKLINKKGPMGSMAPLAWRLDISWFRIIAFAGFLMTVILTWPEIGCCHVSLGRGDMGHKGSDGSVVACEVIFESTKGVGTSTHIEKLGMPNGQASSDTGNYQCNPCQPQHYRLYRVVHDTALWIGAPEILPKSLIRGNSEGSDSGINC